MWLLFLRCELVLSGCDWLVLGCKGGVWTISGVLGLIFWGKRCLGSRCCFGGAPPFWGCKTVGFGCDGCFWGVNWQIWGALVTSTL